MAEITSPTGPVHSGQAGLVLALLAGSRRFRIWFLSLVSVIFILALVHQGKVTTAVSTWDWPPLPGTGVTKPPAETDPVIPEPEPNIKFPPAENPGSNDVIPASQPQDSEPEDKPVSGLVSGLLHYTGPSEPFSIPDASTIDWSRFAYTQYVTNANYLCNSIMVFETLHRLGSRADRLMMYPTEMLPDPAAVSATSDEGRLIIKARDEYKVKLAPITVQSRPSNDQTWAQSFTKLLAFNQTQYARVLSLDSDSTILQPMDELFLLPPCPLAIPRAYWLYPEKKILSSQIMLITPSEAEFKRITAKIEHATPDDYDMEIVNYLYADSALILPHRPYDLLTAEFRREKDNHGYYLGNEEEEWDAVKIFNEAKFLHFSDWPVPKPWLNAPESLREEKQPQCKEQGGKNCVEREIWNGIYEEFKERRGRVCQTGLMSERKRRSRKRRGVV
ncbi:Nucleotide-diphospho-sugar transferase [Naviculisporaceae sp. PSN 640]